MSTPTSPYFSISYDSIPKNPPKKLKKRVLIELIRDLLDTCELNLDDLEPETVEAIARAETYLSNLPWPEPNPAAERLESLIHEVSAYDSILNTLERAPDGKDYQALIEIVLGREPEPKVADPVKDEMLAALKLVAPIYDLSLRSSTGSDTHYIRTGRAIHDAIARAEKGG